MYICYNNNNNNNNNFNYFIQYVYVYITLRELYSHDDRGILCPSSHECKGNWDRVPLPGHPAANGYQDGSVKRYVPIDVMVSSSIQLQNYREENASF